MKRIRPLTAVILAILVAAPASATHGGIHPKFRTQGVYFHCTGDTPLYQANWLAQAGAASSYATWDTSPPPGSVTDGNGCGAADSGWVSNEVYDAVFEGTFSGNLRDMTIRVYDFVLNNDRDDGVPVEMKIYAEVDGVPIFPGGTPDTGYAGRSFSVTPARGNSGATDQFEFSVTNIGFAKEIKDASGNVTDVETGGAALENDNGTMEHTIRILLGLDAFPGEEPQTTGGTFFVWDTTEVPSGITFNPAGLAAATVKADLPDLG